MTKKIKMKKICCNICGKYKKHKNPKILYIFEKILVLSIFAVNVEMKMKKHLKKNNQ